MKSMRRVASTQGCFWLGGEPRFAFVILVAVAAAAPLPGRCGEPRDREVWAGVVKQAFDAVHDGWSSDEVLVRDDLNNAFVTQLPQPAARRRRGRAQLDAAEPA